MLKGYWIPQVDVSDPEGYKAYMAATPPAHQKYNGVALVRGGKLEVLVTHDGIQEVLSATLPPSATSGGTADAGHTGSVLRDHKQLAWWVLNITVVLIAALAISRRTS